MLKAREQFKVKEEIKYDRGLVRSKLCRDRDEPFPVHSRLFICQRAATSFLSTAPPADWLQLSQGPSGNRVSPKRCVVRRSDALDFRNNKPIIKSPRIYAGSERGYSQITASVQIPGDGSSGINVGVNGTLRPHVIVKPEIHFEKDTIL